ncbi:MAG: hypothetical protein FJZ01_27920, partial [Candidatus Sericytochromatia bacterium]|nr:hypothetical protein [Candidatus Tanganyikabacteria bacterium]
DDSVKISDDAFSTSQDIYVYTDDVVNPVEIRVRLLDAFFNGTTWSNIVVTDGQYYSSPASMSVSPPPASGSPEPSPTPEASPSGNP